MADLTITITDEDHRVLKLLEIYEDGSDAEYSQEISDMIADAFDSTRDRTNELIQD